MTTTAVVVDAVRTASGKGKPGGALSGVHSVDLLAEVLRALVDRNGLDPARLDDVIAGCVTQAADQSFNIARNAVLAAGFPESVPGTTVDRQCGSSQQAAHFAAQGVMAGAYDIAVAAGVESMSRVPMGTAAVGRDPFGDRLAARYPGGLIAQGHSAELIAARWGLGRTELDAFSERSHRLAVRAWERGAFDADVVPVGEHRKDETVRPSTSLDGLAALKPSFYDPAVAERFPEIGWHITPGNSSPLTDGASAVLITSEERAAELGLTPRARFHSFAVTGDDPVLMLMGVVPATRKVLAKAGLTIGDIDAFEVNEAFAPVPLAWQRDVGADPERVNVHGGAIALGHALGASGTRLLGTLLGALDAVDGRYGLQVMCEAGGLANATIVERLR
ncbi:steroid 3-ketoacyl-CoA thiolase [Streptomyces sp. WAC 06738]|uniref:thiolase family protein n=1 Tax=Streptomyces sp. WAC 06738 TaxID=2203210 RepID=UPI000F701091|nr:thiolase family protein [Streptomyces sp. WAC 06738]AZM45529.1 steroid 3-ketoacyl-CoA thiolase [Streptomyces sp. WAC 06738]